MGKFVFLSESQVSQLLGFSLGGIYPMYWLNPKELNTKPPPIPLPSSRICKTPISSDDSGINIMKSNNLVIKRNFIVNYRPNVNVNIIPKFNFGHLQIKMFPSKFLLHSLRVILKYK